MSCTLRSIRFCPHHNSNVPINHPLLSALHVFENTFSQVPRIRVGAAGAFVRAFRAPETEQSTAGGCTHCISTAAGQERSSEGKAAPLAGTGAWVLLSVVQGPFLRFSALSCTLQQPDMP
jgi:hypothetical protein